MSILEAMPIFAKSLRIERAKSNRLRAALRRTIVAMWHFLLPAKQRAAEPANFSARDAAQAAQAMNGLELDIRHLQGYLRWARWKDGILKRRTSDPFDYARSQKLRAEVRREIKQLQCELVAKKELHVRWADRLELIRTTGFREEK